MTMSRKIQIKEEGVEGSVVQPGFITGSRKLVTMKLKHYLTGVASFLLLAASAQAAPITFGSVQSIDNSGLGLNSLSQSGTVVQALDIGGAGGSVAGITFVATPSGTVTNGNNASSVAISANPDATFDSILDTLDFTYGGTNPTAMDLTLSGLTVGREYAVQLFVVDNRFPTRQQTFSAGGTSGTVTHGPGGQFVIGTFVADATTQLITANGFGGDAAAVLNALVLRDVTVPEVNAGSASLPLVAVALMLLCLHDAKKRSGALVS